MTFKIPTKTTSTTTKSTTTKSISTKKKAICMGINNYVGTNNDLRGCVNDAKEWASLLNGTYGFEVQTLFDNQVTHNNFTERVGDLISSSKAGDSIVVSYSGHGSNVPDRNGDESDGRDEALVLYDSFLIDDSIREIFRSLHKEAFLTFISDSCHSGTVTRSFLSAINSEDNDNNIRPRYMPPEDDEEAFLSASPEIQTRIFYPEENMNEILISGCLPSEYSYDAYIGGKFRGAMSYYAMQILKSQPEITFENFYGKLRRSLPSGNFPQTPQLEGSDENKKTLMFK